MAEDGGTREIVLADTSVLLNLAIVERLEMLGVLRGFYFHVPDEVIEEVRRPAHRELLDRALGDGHLTHLPLTGVAVLEHFEALRARLGRGESACLALATARGYLIASDEKRLFRREARRLLGEGRVLTTPGLFELAIRQRYWTVEEADTAKGVLERNRFRMRFGSFREVV